MEQNSAQLPATISPETEDREVVMFLESLNIFQEAPEILRSNKKSAMAARAGALRILQEVSANDGKMTAELDEKAKNFLIKIATTLKAMKERREPFTQLAAALSKQFTILESALDIASKTPTDFTRIQGLRNDWAKHCIEEAERLRLEAEKLAEIGKEKARLAGWITKTIGDLLVSYLFNKRQKWLNSFNAIELDTIDESEGSLRAISTPFERAKLGGILRYELPAFPRLSDEQINTTRVKAHEDFDFDNWVAGHDQEMADLKQSLLDRMPALRQELQEAADRKRRMKEEDDKRYQAELQRRQQEEQEREAERIRQEEIARAGKAERIRLQAEAEKARAKAEEDRRQREVERQQEEQRAAELKAKADQERREKEERERQEQDKLRLEREAAEEKSRQMAELSSSSMVAGTLFDQATAASLVEDGPESRRGFEIIVKHPAGWVEIFQFWYQRKGVKMAVDKMGSVKLESMKIFCENAAKDTDKQKGEQISSQYLEYQLSVKAINRKEKKEEEA